MTRRRLAAASLALGLVATACATDGGDDAATSGVTSAEATEQAAAEPIALTVATSDGGTIDFADLAGEDVMLWFWAPW